MLFDSMLCYRMTERILTRAQTQTKTMRREQFGRLLGQLARDWRTEIDTRLASFDLTQARWLVLFRLSKGGNGLSQRALAARVGVKGPTLVRTLDRLEAEGLIERSDTPGDRRVKSIRLTSRAAPERQRIQAAVESVRAEILAGISDADIARCVRVFERIEANLRATAASRAPPRRRPSE